MSLRTRVPSRLSYGWAFLIAPIVALASESCAVEDARDYTFESRGGQGGTSGSSGLEGGNAGTLVNGGSTNPGAGGDAGAPPAGDGGDTSTPSSGGSAGDAGQATTGGSSEGGAAGANAGTGNAGTGNADAGGAAGSGTETCAPNTFDCNGDPDDGCEAVGVAPPAAVTPLAPFRGAYTGSLHAPSNRRTLRPTLRWSESATDCGEVYYEVELDDSCEPGNLRDCSFPSPELSEVVDEPMLAVARDLPVATEPPVGALYAWRVRACDASERCSAWSDVAYLHVGRTPEDINGDGYADLLVHTSPALLVYFGSAAVDFLSDTRIEHPSAGAYHVGDVNGDGFADLGLLGTDYELCATSGYYLEVLYGGTDIENATVQSICRTGGSPSVQQRSGFVGDLDGDGFADFPIARGFGSSENNFMVHAGGPEVAQTPFLDFDTTLGAAAYTSSIEMSFDGYGDFDGDGFVDVLVGASGRGEGFNRYALVRGGAEPATTFAGSFDYAGCISQVWTASLGDVNGDGKGDWGITCWGEAGHVFGIVYGGAELPDELSVVLESPDALGAVSRALDFDNDGTLEVFVGAGVSGALVWRHGDFDPEAPERFVKLNHGSVMTVADHDGDGRDDVAFGSEVNQLWLGSFTSFNVTARQIVLPDGVETMLGIVY
ncbi:MAG: VCBS repeat-containing protein [Pseudomonadota bacterium]|nr:MAG: hypothetical protein DIU78_20810 [Pseudomonadota bacterium]